MPLFHGGWFPRFRLGLCVAADGPFAAEAAPTGTAQHQRLCGPCGSGFSREEAGAQCVGLCSGPVGSMQAVGAIMLSSPPLWL
ncbi:hypothetical protein D0O09_16275 [Pseudomonas putida]|nr:hypothetical protein D0O09_16275 [Pseudomonas putida]